MYKKRVLSSLQNTVRGKGDWENPICFLPSRI